MWFGESLLDTRPSTNISGLSIRPETKALRWKSNEGFFIGKLQSLVYYNNAKQDKFQLCPKHTAEPIEKIVYNTHRSRGLIHSPKYKVLTTTC